MPEKCLSCGEVAVIEDSVDGGRDQLICIECGTLADANTAFKSSDFIEEDDDPCEDNIDEGSVMDMSGHQSIPVPDLVECVSCGVEFVSRSWGQGMSASSSSSRKRRKICSDCAEFEFEEEEQEKSEDEDKCPATVGSTSQEKDGALGSCQTLHAMPTNEPQSKCSSCGSGGLIIDSVNGDDRLICISCGQVNSDAILTTSSYFDDVGTTSAKYYRTTLPTFANRDKVQLGLQEGLTEVSCLCTKFCFQPNIKSEAQDLYKRLYNHPKIKNVSQKKKRCIAAVCLFVVCRRFDLPISVTHFKKDVACFSLFLRMKTFLCRKIGITLPHISASRQLADIVNHLKFNQELTNKVKDILLLFSKAWLTPGKNRASLISLAAYYAYVSSNQCNKFISWRKYFARHKLCHVSRQLIRECEYTLCKLASSLPWVKSKEITSKELPRYIDSILQYRESLFHLVFRLEEPPCVQTMTRSTSTQCTPSHSENDTKIFDDCDGTSTNVCKKKPLVPLCKKEYLLPWASKRRKTETVTDDYYPIPSNVDLDSPNLRESEFEDEISSYIFSAEERESIREHKLAAFNSNV